MSQAIGIPSTMFGTADEAAPATVRGRRTEQEHLTRWVRRLVHRNGGGVLWIDGPAGIGKSRMLAFAVDEASLVGARVLVCAGVTTGGTTPLAPLLDALTRDAEPGLVHRLRSRPPRETDPYWLLQEVKNRLRTLARDRPLVMVLDDLHHCDDLTLQAVRTLTVQLAGLPVLWVLAARVHTGVAAVESLRRDLLNGRAAHLELAPLAPDAVRQLTEDLLGPDAVAAAPYLDCLDGLPGAVRQVCALLESGLPTVTHGSPGVRSGSAGKRPVIGPAIGPVNAPVDGPVDDPVIGPVVIRRLDQLSEEGRELTLIAAVLGDGLTVRHLSQVLGRPESALLRPVREVLAARLLHAGPEQLVFPHPLVREILAAALPRPVRLSVRRRSIDLRVEAGVPAVSLAPELIGTAEPGDTRAVRILRTAARELAHVSPASAAVYLKHAASLIQDGSLGHVRLSAELIPLLWRTGDIAGARDLAHTIVQAPPDPLTHARACLEVARMGSQFLVTQPETHMRHVHVRRDVPVSLKDQLLMVTWLNRLLAGDIDDAGGLVTDSPMRTRGMHPVSELTHRTLRSMSACHRQNWGDALEHSEAAAAGAAELDPVHAAALPEVAVSTSWRASLLSLAGEDRSAMELVDSGLAEAEQHGRHALAPLWRTARARLLLDGGRLADAAKELTAALATASATGTSWAGEAAALCTMARVAFHSGDDATMETCATKAAAHLASDRPQSRRIGAWISVLAAVYHDERLTEHRLGAATPFLRRGFVHSTCADPADLVILVRAALDRGLREPAVSAVRFAEDRARRNPLFRLLEATALHARGLLESDRTRLMNAAERYGQARPLLRAHALEDAGELMASVGDTAARTCLEQAFELYETCGAHRESRRARSRLRKLGVTPAAAGQIPDERWRGLTPAELSVVRLIAHGATNRQAADRLFLSPNTVNTHMRHVFEKLGVRSRVQMARLYLREVDQPAEAA